ncbi:Crp/Fnr family transcriptional regulator [Chitinilyticum litopenaei]|uniref:Crp/Fnr family transcriptional regulator n=1 Tax=Chitinilyticum litopenaei TaxID=1121276 RepID=UPI00041F673F|nr:Crp/Fnr family transcriptional regulator [Chitinilyticum litopenaei]
MAIDPLAGEAANPADADSTLLMLLFPLLHAFSAEARAALLTEASWRAAVAGEILWHEGDAIAELLLLTRGVVRAIANADDGPRAYLYGHMAAGAVAGLHVLFTEPVAQVNLVVQEDCRYLALPLTALRRALDAHPAAWEAVARELAQGVYHLVNSLNLLGQSNGYQRLRRLLVRLDRRARNSHDISGVALSQQELAARIGLSREMVNRMLGELRSGGYLTQDERGRFLILKPLPHAF